LLLFSFTILCFILFGKCELENTLNITAPSLSFRFLLPVELNAFEEADDGIGGRSITVTGGGYTDGDAECVLL
jgi:hypothetical protein